MSVARPNLRLIDENGELTEYSCPNCTGMEHELKELERKMRGLARELGELRKDRDSEARAHQEWPRASQHFDRWRTLSGHLRCSWTSDRFWLIQPFLGRHDDDIIDRAIRGHCFDPYTIARKNGSIRRFDSWELLWRDEGHFEEACNKAPRQ